MRSPCLNSMKHWPLLVEICKWSFYKVPQITHRYYQMQQYFCQRRNILCCNISKNAVEIVQFKTIYITSKNEHSNFQNFRHWPKQFIMTSRSRTIISTYFITIVKIPQQDGTKKTSSKRQHIYPYS